MSALVHCDGPDCNETRDATHQARTFSTPYWIRVEERPDTQALDFHSRECLANWANEGRNSWSTWRNVPEDRTCAGCDKPARYTTTNGTSWCEDHGPDGTIARSQLLADPSAATGEGEAL